MIWLGSRTTESVPSYRRGRRFRQEQTTEESEAQHGVSGRGIGLVLGGVAVLVLLAGCTAEVPAAVGAARYRSVGLSGSSAALAADVEAAPVTVWFEQDQGQLQLIAAGPVNTTTVPVAFQGSAVVPGAAGARTTAIGCAGTTARCSVDNNVDHWLARFVSKQLTYRSSGSTLQLTAGPVTLTMRREPSP